MKKYYRGNAIYDLIESTYNFRYTSENLWILVYGNREADPKVILLLSGYSKDDYESKSLTTKESEMLIYTEQISHKSGVPFLYVRFNGDASKLTDVKIMVTGKFKTISTDEYRNILVGFGIQQNNRSCSKPINSQASNVYHLWQKDCGLDIITSDIDLMYVDSELDITDVYELKRSYIPMDDWAPYSNDFNNFILLSKLFEPCKINFYILFNQYQKFPYVDDINKLKIYKVTCDGKLNLENQGIKDLADFLLRK